MEKFNENSDKLMELLGVYGSLSKIPDAELDNIGYVRREDGRVVRADALEEIDDQEKEKTPFEPTKFEVTTTVDHRPIEDHFELIKLLNKIQELKNDLDNIPIAKSKMFELKKENDLAFRAFLEDFQAFFQDLYNKSGESDIEGNDLGYEVMGAIERISLDSLMDILWDAEKNFIEESKYLNEDGVLEKEGSSLLESRLERMKGVLADLEEMEKGARRVSFESGEYFKLMTEVIGSAEELNSVFERIFGVSLKEDTLSHLMVAMFNSYIEGRLGWPKLESTEIMDYAEELEGLFSDPRKLPAYAEFKEVSQRMKGAQTVEEKKAISQEMKEAKEKLEGEKRVVKNLLYLIRQYEALSDYFVGQINGIQEHLTRGGKEERVLEFTMDPAPDPEKDLNPGEVSGDCTDGKPLPFGDPRIDLWNLKIFANEEDSERHIGNAYLLETVVKNNDELAGKKVWHLDAVQIPMNLDWDTAIERFFQNLSERAKERGVEIITVNEEDPSISNYDYISDAIIKYHKKTGYGFVDVDKNDDFVDEGKNSPFQGGEHCRIIWKAE